MSFTGSGGRRKILEIGNLIISPVSRDDEGLYTCQAQNKYGSDTSHGRLIVLSRYNFLVLLLFSYYLVLRFKKIVTVDF